MRAKQRVCMRPGLWGCRVRARVRARVKASNGMMKRMTRVRVKARDGKMKRMMRVRVRDRARDVKRKMKMWRARARLRLRDCWVRAGLHPSCQLSPCPCW